MCNKSSDVQIRQPTGQWLPVSTVQKTLNISRSHAYCLIHSGAFIALKVGGAIRVSKASLDDYISRQISLFVLENGGPYDDQE